MLQLRGRSALSEFRLNQLIQSLQNKVADIASVHVCFMHFVDTEQALPEED